MKLKIFCFLSCSFRYVVDQLQCLGILQTCEVLKVGMPTRVTYTELKEVLGDNAADAEVLFEGEPETALIAAILWAFEVTVIQFVEDLLYGGTSYSVVDEEARARVCHHL